MFQRVEGPYREQRFAVGMLSTIFADRPDQAAIDMPVAEQFHLPIIGRDKILHKGSMQQQLQSFNHWKDLGHVKES
jgi:hypothetical protein